MESIAPECTKLKEKYDACFTQWYAEKFLKGDSTPICEKLFAEYRACLVPTLKEKKIDKILEQEERHVVSIVLTRKS